MSISDTLKAQQYASISETAAAQAKIYASKLEMAPDYADQAQQSAISAANSAQQASDAISEVNALAISASQSATSAEASAAEAGDAAAQAVSQCIRVPDGESISVLADASARADSFIIFGADGDTGVMPKAGVAILDNTGKIPVSMIPAIAISQPFVVTSQAAMLALDAQTGDVAKRTDLGLSFILSASPASVLGNWIQLNDDVLSILGMGEGASQVGAEDENGDATTVQAELNKIQLSLSKASTSATFYDANSLKISNLQTPANTNDATTKGYVDQIRTDLSQNDGALEIGNFASSAGVISAKLYGVVSGVDCASVIQTLQDLSESLRIPIDFSGIAEVRFSGRVQIGDWFHWKGAGRFNTVIKPLSLTRSEVGTYGDGVYAWFSRKDPTQSLDFAMLEDIGFDGQYQDGYEIGTIAPQKMIIAFAWHFKNTAVGRNITALRCHLKNCPHEGWHGYTTGGGQIDGINYLECSSEGTNPLVTSVGFNAFKCMNGSIDSPGAYSTYTIRNILSRGNTSFGHRTMNDLKRGCEHWTIDACQTYDMNDCHHSTDGSRFGTFTGSNIGIQTGVSYNTKNYFELQAENVSILGGTYKAAPGTSQAGQAGIFIADYKYPSETNYHQSKNIIIDNVNISNVNQGAVRLNNTANVRVGNVTAEFCNGAAVSWELTSGHIDGVTLVEIVPSNNQQGDVATRGSLTEINIATGHSVAITGTIKSAGYLSRLGSGNIVYQGNKPFTVMNPTYRNNDRMLINVTSSAPTKTDFATPPVSVPYAFTLNDTNTASAQGLSVGKIAINTNGCVYFDVFVIQGTATAAAVIFRELNSSGTAVSTTYLNAYIPTAWANRSYIYKPTNANCVAVEVLLAPACDTSGTVTLTGTTSFSDVRLSDMPI